MKTRRTKRVIAYRDGADSTEIALKLIMVLTLSLLITLMIVAQPCELTVVVFDRSSNEPIPYATVELESESAGNVSGVTNYAGEAVFSELDSGAYTLKVKTTGYNAREVKNVSVDTESGTRKKVAVTPKFRLAEVLFLTLRFAELVKR